MIKFIKISSILFFLIFILLEIYIHISRPTIYEYSKTLGWKVKSNYKKEFNFEDLYKIKYKGIYQTNNYGARYLGNDESDLKILVIGDSFTMDPHTGNNKAWFGVLKNNLEAKKKIKIQVMAIGGGGYGTNQQYILTKNFLKQSGYKPNLVILQFCVNDFMNNSYEWESRTENFNQFLRRPFLKIDNHYYYDQSFFGEILRSKYLSFLRLPTYLTHVISLLHLKFIKEDIDQNILDESLNITENILVKLKKIFVNKNVYTFNCKDSSVYPESNWSQVLSSAGYIVLTEVSSKLYEISKTKKIFFKDGGHYNELGNIYIGDFISNELNKELLLK